MYTSRKFVSCQAAIASRLTPTVRMRNILERCGGCQAAIAGKPAPTVNESVPDGPGLLVKPPSQQRTHYQSATV
jgi:hypothetical protein